MLMVHYILGVITLPLVAKVREVRTSPPNFVFANLQLMRKKNGNIHFFYGSSTMTCSVNFKNVLQAAFTFEDLEAQKRLTT
jgi:hypothetical protein